jgi:hypothetical protein
VLVSACVKQAPDPAQLRADETSLIEATATDPASAESLLVLLQERDRLIDETRSLLHQYRREMKTLNSDYDASRELLVEMIDYYNRERARKQLRFIDLITRMKQSTSAEEWDVIADFQLANFSPRRLIYRPLAAGAPDMLDTMLSVFLLGGGLMGGMTLNPDDVKAVKQRVEVSIDDNTRLAAAAKVLDQLETEVKDFNRVFTDSGERLGDIYRNHATASRQLLHTLEALNLEWYVSQFRSIKLRNQLKEAITAEEWPMVFTTR